MTTLQDILGLITKRKIKTPTDNDYIISAAYTDTQERLKPQPKMEASLLSIGAIKNYILASIVPPTPPTYKVFTALLSQNGGSSPYNIGSGDLIIGVTYGIQDNSSGADFTNVGAPNNEVGTYFVATGTTPNSWGSTGTLSYDEGAPVVTVLENTIGNIWFTYNSIGNYSVNSNNLFIEDKTTIDIDTFGRNASNIENTPFYIGNETIIIAESQFNIFTTRSPDYRNDVLQKNRIEIRVYN